MEKLENDKNLFSKLSANIIGYMLEFFSYNEISTFFRINKKFQKALDSEKLWQNFILSNELFVSSDRSHFTT